MKKYFRCFIYSVVLCSLLCSYNKSEAVSLTENTTETQRQPVSESAMLGEDVGEIKSNEQMPQPFIDGIDGDANALFYQPCITMLNNIPVEIMKLRDETEVNNWINSFPSIDSAALCSVNEYANLFSFISFFKITKDEAEIALHDYLTAADEQIRITQQEFDVIFSGDIESVTEMFASEYSIVVKDSIYCPNWVYYHTAYDYELAGISKEEIIEKVLKYSDFDFTDDARTALEKKLSSYTGVEVNIETEPQPISENIVWSNVSVLVTSSNTDSQITFPDSSVISNTDKSLTTDNTSIAQQISNKFMDYWEALDDHTMIGKKVEVFSSDFIKDYNKTVFLVYEEYKTTRALIYGVNGDDVELIGDISSGFEFALSKANGGMLRATKTSYMSHQSEEFDTYYKISSEGIEETQSVSVSFFEEDTVTGYHQYYTNGEYTEINEDEYNSLKEAADSDFTDAVPVNLNTDGKLRMDGGCEISDREVLTEYILEKLI